MVINNGNLLIIMRAHMQTLKHGNTHAHIQTHTKTCVNATVTIFQVEATSVNVNPRLMFGDMLKVQSHTNIHCLLLVYISVIQI